MAEAEKKKTLVILAELAALVAVLLIFTAIPAYSCTEIYVGADVSEDGTVIVARSLPPAL